MALKYEIRKIYEKFHWDKSPTGRDLGHTDTNQFQKDHKLSIEENTRILPIGKSSTSRNWFQKGYSGENTESYR